MDNWVQIISTLGFPIVATIGCAFFIYRVWQAEQSQNTKREENMMSLVRELSTKLAELGRIVDENTKVLSVLKQDIDHLKETIHDDNRKE